MFLISQLPFLKNGRSYTAASVKRWVRVRRDGPLYIPILEVLWTTRSEAGGKEIRGAVVDGAAVGVRRLEHQPVAETPGELGLQAVVDGGAAGASTTMLSR